MSWKIRPSEEQDLSHLQAIYDEGRNFQLATGNLSQWAPGYPGQAQIVSDYDNQYLIVLEGEEQQILAVMALIPGQDPTYLKIEGAWLNDQPYLTIHRIAARTSVKGAGRALIEWAQEQADNIRIDTHEDNQPMIKLLEKLNFKYCGVIYLANGHPRNAYHYSRKKE